LARQFSGRYAGLSRDNAHTKLRVNSFPRGGLILFNRGKSNNGLTQTLFGVFEGFKGYSNQLSKPFSGFELE